jgi:hypothetical protein
MGADCLLNPSMHNLQPNTTPNTGNKPLTSPKTNLEFGEVGAQIFPNVLVRGFVIEAATREWEAAERRWQQWNAEQQQEG